MIHDVHAWTITSGYEALTAHVLVDPDYEGDLDRLLRRLRRIAARDFGIGHVTLQVEQSVEDCTEDHHVDHLVARQRSPEPAPRITGCGLRRASVYVPLHGGGDRQLDVRDRLGHSLTD